MGRGREMNETRIIENKAIMLLMQMKTEMDVRWWMEKSPNERN